MKLNAKRTALVGLAFMAISAFWNLYDTMVPLILDQTYGLGETWTGVVMAMDNIAALVLLPVFGALSDRAGRRIPFILWGSMAAAALSIVLPLVVKQGIAAPVQGQGLAGFLAVLAMLLVAMGTFRSPAVALMPDVTPKHLRSKGNAIINLMGAIGGALMLVLPKFLVNRLPLESSRATDSYAVLGGRTGALASVQREEDALELMFHDVGDYTWLFVTAAVLLIVSAWVVKLVIPERKLKAEAEAITAHREAMLAAAGDSAKHPANDSEKQPVRRLSRAELRSLLLILASVFLWFMAYNAVTTAFSRYALKEWHIDEGDASFCLLVATAAAIASYWPVGILSSRLGRKKVILAGVVMLITGFGVAAMLDGLSFVSYLLFALVGIGWASINVNSYPMVVELATGADVGKYTGYYYTFSMAAQVLTPVLSGALLEHVGYWTLFPYSAVMAICALLTMFFVRHGDSKPEAKGVLEALGDIDD